MKMRSKIICIFNAAILAGCGFASQPNDVFVAHKESILSHVFSCKGGYCFGVGYGVAISDTSQSIKICADKSVLQASANLLKNILLDKIDWPKSVRQESRVALLELLAESVAMNRTISGLCTIYSEELSDKRIASVVAVAESSASNITYTIEEAEGVLLAPRWLRKNFHRKPRELYEFYLTQKELPKELEGIDFKNWNSEQLDLFCGITRVVKNDVGVKDSYAKGESEAKILNNDKIGKEGNVRKNHESVTVINETIGF